MTKWINFRCGFVMSMLVIVVSCADRQEPLVKQIRFSVDRVSTDGKSGGRLQSSPDPVGVLVTIRDANGSVVKDQEWLDLYKFGDTYLSVPLTLSAAESQFYLSEFFVLDQNHTVLYTTPIEGSKYAHLVQDPLDIEFFVNVNAITTVTPEVIEIDETSTPSDYGYGQFDFQIVKKIQVVISSFIRGESNFELTEAHLKVEGFNDTTSADTTASWSFETDLEEKANSVTIKEASFYRITATKSGYSTWVRHRSLADQDKIEIIFEAGDTKFETIWNKNYGGSLQDFNSGSILTSDGGLVILSTSSSNNYDVTSNLGDLDAWIVKLNTSGSIEWSRNYGTSAPDWATSIVEYKDGSGYLVTGYSYGNSQDGKMLDNGWMFKISPAGKVVWEKKLGKPRYASAALANQAGNFIVTCWGSNTNELAFAPVKEINSTGEIVWEKPLPFPVSGDGIIVGTDDGYIGTYNRTTYKVNLQGEMQWALGDGFKVKSSHQEFFPNAEGYLVIGNEYAQSNDPNQYHPEYTFVAQLDREGQVVWKNKIQSTGDISISYAIKSANGNFMVVGWQYGTNNTTEPWLAEVTSLGNVVREKTMKGTYQGSYTPSSYFKYIVPHGDRFLVTGQTNQYDKDSPNTNYGYTDVWATMFRF